MVTLLLPMLYVFQVLQHEPLKWSEIRRLVHVTKMQQGYNIVVTAFLQFVRESRVK
jgi:hypothetical protein